jgi:hypothetical protein
LGLGFGFLVWVLGLGFRVFGFGFWFWVLVLGFGFGFFYIILSSVFGAVFGRFLVPKTIKFYQGAFLTQNIWFCIGICTIFAKKRIKLHLGRISMFFHTKKGSKKRTKKRSKFNSLI